MKISNTKKRKQQHGLTVQEIYVIIHISLVHVLPPPYLFSYS